MEPTAADVMPKVIIRESLAVTGGTSQEQAAREIGKKVVDKAKEGEWRKALEETQRKKPIEQKNIDRKLDEIGVARDATTGKKDRTPEEEARFNRVKNTASLAKEIIEKGYDRVGSIGQGKLRTITEDAIKSNPLSASEFSSLTVTQQKTEIERRLRDPKFLADLSEEVNAQLNPEKKLIEEQKIVDREEDVKDKEFKKTEAQDAVTALNNQIKALDQELKAFERSPAGSAIGSNAIELDGIRSNINTIKAEMDTYKVTLDDVKVNLQDLITEKQMTLRYGSTQGRRDAATIDGEIASKRTEMKNAQREVDTREGKIRRITELETQEASLKAKKEEIEASKKTKDLDLKKADLELSKAQRRLDDLKREREYEEEDLASNMENVFSRTADKYIRDEIQAMKTPVDAELEDAKKKTSNADEQALYGALRKRWEKTVKNWRGKEKIMINKEQTEEDFADLMETGSPDNIMRKMLKIQANVSTGANYTHGEIDVLLADKADSGFYKKMAPEVILQILRRKILARGITKEDVFNIQNSQWGEGMITKALDKNKANAKELETLIGEKAVNPGFRARLWEETKKRPWLLAILLGFAVLPILAAKEGSASPMVK